MRPASVGEDLAAEHFERLGFEVLARNHRTRFGELDLVVYDGDDARLRRGQDAPVRLARAVGEPARPQALAGPPDGDRVADGVHGPPVRRAAALRRRRASCSTPTDELVRLDHLEGGVLMLARVHDVRGRRGRRAGASGWRPTSARGCRRSPSSGSRTRRCARRASACARRCVNSGYEFPLQADHGQPRAGLPAQGRPGVRPAARGRRCSSPSDQLDAGGDRERAR